jgi:hypothetical protein
MDVSGTSCKAVTSNALLIQHERNGREPQVNADNAELQARLSLFLRINEQLMERKPWCASGTSTDVLLF